MSSYQNNSSRFIPRAYSLLNLQVFDQLYSIKHESLLEAGLRSNLK